MTAEGLIELIDSSVLDVRWLPYGTRYDCPLNLLLTNSIIEL